VFLNLASVQFVVGGSESTMPKVQS